MEMSSYIHSLATLTIGGGGKREEKNVPTEQDVAWAQEPVWMFCTG
jgi:hypothetical protein